MCGLSMPRTPATALTASWSDSKEERTSATILTASCLNSGVYCDCRDTGAVLRGAENTRNWGSCTTVIVGLRPLEYKNVKHRHAHIGECPAPGPRRHKNR